MDGINCIKFLLLICKFVLKFAPDCGVKDCSSGHREILEIEIIGLYMYLEM